MKISIITTVFNEESSILELLKSINNQTKKPDEIIIVDGESTDNTVKKINEYKLMIKAKGISFKLIIKKGNRSVGRNTAVENSIGDLIVCTDAGCILDRDWVKNIIKPFEDKNIDVVAGYYDSKPKNVFEKSLVPYVLVMRDKLDPNNFLPSTRSMAFKKSIWNKVGKFDENLSNNEDFAFSKNLLKINAKIAFAEDAIAWWMPRENLLQAFKMFYRFALGDIEAGILRPKVSFIFIRYLFGILLFIISVITENIYLLLFALILLSIYIVWAINKNYKYVNNTKAFIYLPILQITSDIAVISGSSLGVINRLTINRVNT